MALERKSSERLSNDSDFESQSCLVAHMSDGLTQAALDALPAHIAIIDHDGTILFVNAAWLSFASDNDGLAARVGMGINYLDVCERAVGEDAARINQFGKDVRAVLRGELSSLDFEYPCPSQTLQRWFVARVTRFISDDEPRAIIVHEDVTARRAAAEQTQRHQASFQSSAVGQALVSLDGRFIDVNDKLVSMLEYEASELEGAQYTQFNHPEDQAVGHQQLLTLLETDTQAFFEKRYVTKSGRILWVAVNVAVVRGSLNEPKYFVASLVDITERKYAESALREIERNFRNFFETAHYMVIVMNLDGVVLYANPEVSQKLGFQREELQQQPAETIIQPSQREGFAQIVRLAKHDQRVQCLLWLNKKDQGELKVEAGLWLGNWEGKPCIFALIKDLTAEQEAIQQFEHMFRKNPALMIVTDAESREITDVNDAWLTTFGFERAEVIGKPRDEIRILVQPEVTRPLLDTLQQQGYYRDVEIPLVTKQGIRLYGLCSGEVIYLNGKQQLLTVIIDVTERRRVEVQLEENRNRLSLALDSAGLGVWTWDIKSNTRDFDTRTCRLLGIEPERFHGTSEEFFSLVSPTDLDRVKAALAKTLKHGAPYWVDYQVVWPDGTQHFISSRGRLVRDKNGNPERLDGITWDQTERVRAEQALYKSEERFRQLAEVFPETIFEADLNGIVTYANERGLQTFGYDRSALGHVRVLDLVAPEDRELLAARLRERFSGNIGGFLEYRAIRKAGERFDALAYSSPIQEMGKVVGIRGFILDISERKQAEVALRESNEQLREAIVRANELARQAELASDAKGNFLANVSHEIRTPMNGVIGMTGLLLETDLNPAQRSYAECVRKSAESLLALINDILDFSKIEAGRIELESLDFDLGALLKEFVDLMGAIAKQKGVEFKLDVHKDVPARLQGDPGRLRQVLNNLVSNAFKFTAMGSVSLNVEASMRYLDEVIVRFAVRDTGIGIPQDKLDGIFEKFTQVDASTTRKYGGTGLGLAIARQLCILMKGEIGVNSELGKGSEFWFTARFSIPKEQPAQSTRFDPIVVTGLESDLKAKPVVLRVLVVEDNITNQQVALAILRKLGHRAEAAANGREAIEALRTVPYDLVFMDLQMPEMDGIEATRRIRSGDCGPACVGLPIIAMTAHARKSDRELCLQAGMNGYVSKPVAVGDIADACTQWSRPTRSLSGTPREVELPSRAEASTSAFDETILLNRLMGDREAARSIARAFLQDTGSRIADLQSAYDRQNTVDLVRLAHSIRGAAAIVGASEVARAASVVESSTLSDGQRPAPASIEDVCRQFETFREAMLASRLWLEEPGHG